MFEAIYSVLSTIFMLVVILALAYICTKYIATAGRGITTGGNIKIIEQVGLGNQKSLAIVKVGKEYMLIGTTATQISLIKELSEDSASEIELNPIKPTQINFKQVFDKTKGRSEEV